MGAPVERTDAPRLAPTQLQAVISRGSVVFAPPEPWIFMQMGGPMSTM